MGLKVWLPLTKDLHNQGTSQVTVTNNGATYSASGGKLGGCYEFNGSSSYIDTNIIIPNFATDKNYTISFWMYPTTTSGTKPIIGTGPDWGWVIYQKGTDLEFNQWDSAGADWPHITISNIIITNTWMHVCFAYNQGNMAVYINGILKTTWTAPTGRTIKVCSNTVKIGGNIYAWHQNYFLGKLNDVRIYDHCLSLEEVKEISKGLVLHYPLEGPILQGRYDQTIYEEPDGSLWIRIFHHNNPSNGLFNSSKNFNKGVYIDTDRWYDVEGPCNMMTKWEFMVKQKNTSNSDEVKNRWIQNINPMLATYDQIKPTSITRITTFGYTNGSGGGLFTDSSSNRTRLRISDGSASNWYGAAGCWTAFSGGIPGYPSSVCTTGYFDIYIRIDNCSVGLTPTIEYDGSGFQNNGTRTGIFTWSSDTPKYEVSTQFNGTQYIQVPFSCGTISEAVSVAVWGYESNWNTPSAERLIGAATSSSGWCIGDYGSENTLFAFYANGSYNTAPGFKQLSAGWHHFVITFDGLHLNYYVDGQLFSSKTFSTKQIVTGNYNIEIGRHYGGGCNFKGCMSDARIYATALSENDIKSLYQNEAYIDTNETVYGAIRSRD